MISYYKFILMATFTPLVCALLGSPVYAGESPGTTPVALEAVPADEAEYSLSLEGGAPDENLEKPRWEEPHTIADATAGYRFLHVDGFGGRAAEYDYLHSRPTFGGLINRLGSDFKFALEGNYLNEKDFSGDILTDYRGEYRFHLRTESLYHNLDHEPLEQNFTNARYQGIDQDPMGRYGIRAEQDEVSFRYKLHNYPLHVNLGYWRLFRDGTSQLRFSDTMFEYTGANTINSVGRRTNQETHEGRFGLDAHLGVVDLVYTFQIREFSDNAAIPVFPYVARTSTDPSLAPIAGGNEQHNENPDSRYLAHTVKLHTSLDGGIVGAASYTYGKRENRSALSSVQGAGVGRDTLQNVAGDFVYIPCNGFTLALKFRHQEVDRDNPAVLFVAADGSTLNVRPAMDTQKDAITATVSVRTNNRLTMKGEYKGEFLHRDNVASWSAPAAQVTQNLPGNSALQKGTAALLYRPVTGLRLKAQYSYSVSDNPSYGTSFGEKHEGELFASYNSLNRWGATANYRLAREINDGIVDTTFAHTFSGTTFLPIGTATFRNRETDNVTLSLWVAPLPRFTLSGSYGLLRARTDQGVLFADLAISPPVAFANANYTTQAQIYGVTGVYNANERLDLSLALQEILSFSDYSPDQVVFSPTSSTANIGELSRTKTVQTSASARAEYHLTKNLSGVVDYTYRDYNEKIQRLANGAVHAISAYVSGKW